MAEKHKSKYKRPENTKYKSRKDLKDYTEDDKKGTMNPKSAGEKQSNVLRKTDKEVVDTGDMYVKYNADDRLYKDLEDGEYDPKHASKVLKKRQDADEKDNEKNIKDKIENLTREQKEHFVREYVRRKLNKILSEQSAPEPEAAPAEEPIDAPAEEPTAPAAPDAAATPDPMAAPATDIPAEPATDTAAPAPAEAPMPAAPDAATQATPEEMENRTITSAAQELAKEGNIGKIKLLNKMINIATTDIEPADKETFYKLLRSFAIKKLGTTKPQ